MVSVAIDSSLAMVCCCHSAGLVATILSSGVDVLAVLWVSVVFRATRMHCYGDSISLVSVLFRSVPFHSVVFFGFLQDSMGF